MSASITAFAEPQNETDFEHDDFMRVLGDELRRARNEHRWSRKELRARLTQYVSLPTLASYELGTRHCSVNRFVEICDALETTAPELLARVLRRSDCAIQRRDLHIDLRAVVCNSGSTFPAFRRWAQHRLATSPKADDSIHLDASAVELLAELCSLTKPDLVTYLTKLGAVLGGGPPGQNRATARV
ncbi:MAG TPA: helix-turn-helix transcriptional regulator [Actinophytocola sp.]|jgi:transcriptional regulator with XRE-family HTH domain|nr:helix-turn-helix transcriptional regulator [Actinophytocola sp.]